MPAFKRRVLQVLDRIYRIDGDKAPNDIETEVPIQLVHDTSRDAALGAAFGIHGGYWFYSQRLTHAGADVQTSSMTWSGLYTGGFLFEGALPPIEEVWTWFITCQAVPSAAVINRWSASIRIPANTSENAHDIYIPLVSSTLDDIYSGSAGNIYTMYGNASTGTQMFRERPFIWPPNCSFRTRSESSGAATNDVWILAWTGMKGVPPPGMR